MKTSFDTALLESGAYLRRGFLSLINNVGKVIAAITLFVATLVTFTDVGFADIRSESFSSVLAIMLVASYLMYFSLEDSGERLGEESEQFKGAKEEYDALRAKIEGGDVAALRLFLSDYARHELEYRRNMLLLRHGYNKDELYRLISTGGATRKQKRIYARAMREKPFELSVRSLLSGEASKRNRELQNPEGRKLMRMILKMLPTTLCTLLTVSVALTVKEDMSWGAVIGGILKLSALPIIGFRGYQDGYTYAKGELTMWLETKTRLLDAFIKAEKSNCQEGKTED